MYELIVMAIKGQWEKKSNTELLNETCHLKAELFGEKTCTQLETSQGTWHISVCIFIEYSASIKISISTNGVQTDCV